MKSKVATRTGLRKLVPSFRLPPASSLRSFSAEEVESLKRLAAQLMECVYDPRFAKRGAEGIFLAPLESYPVEETVDLSQMEDLDLLADGKRRSLEPSAEREWFLCYNYARYRLMRVARQFKGRRLTVAGARALLRWDRAAITARNAIARANLGLVPAMVQRADPKGAEFGELISEGHMALLRAVDKFDCNRGFRFSTYACRAILTSLSRTVQKSVRYRSRFPAEYDPALQKSDYLETRRADKDQECVGELVRILADNAAELTAVEQRVLSERFGLGAGRKEGDPAVEKTLRQIAASFGVTKERVRQIQNKALAKLRSALERRVFAA